MVRQFVQQNNINNLNVGISSNPLTINDCLNFEQRNNYNIGSNQIYCNICNQLSDSISTTKIYSTSHYLIMLLNIGVGKVYDVKLKFSSQIDISTFMELLLTLGKAEIVVILLLHAKVLLIINGINIMMLL